MTEDDYEESWPVPVNDQPVGRRGMSARHRDYFIRAGFCPCDPTIGESCRHCDGTAAEEKEAWLDARDRRP